VSSWRVCRGSQKAWHVLRETHKNLGDPNGSRRKVGRQTETSSRKADDLRESDQLIVLRDGKAVHTQHLWFCAGVGKELTRIRNSQRKHKSDMQGRINCANLTAGNKQLVTKWVIATEASIFEEPGAIIPHAGICAGGGRVTALSTATIQDIDAKRIWVGVEP
jgi:hypothetical protein